MHFEKNRSIDFSSLSSRLIAYSNKLMRTEREKGIERETIKWNEKRTEEKNTQNVNATIDVRKTQTDDEPFKSCDVMQFHRFRLLLPSTFWTICQQGILRVCVSINVCVH